MNERIKRVCIMGMLSALACVLSVVESFIPVFVPGVKLGLANVIILIMLYEFKPQEALVVDILRIVVASVLRGTLLTPTFWMSLSGGMLSYIVMLILSRLSFFSIVGVSSLGSIFHCVGQIIVAILVMGTEAVLYYLPFIGLLSLATGIFSGFIALAYLKRSITGKYITVRKNKWTEEKIEN